MASKKPGKIKAKLGDQRLGIMAVWPGKQGGHYLTPESAYQDRPGLASITLTDGTVITAEGGQFIDQHGERVFVDLYLPEEQTSAPVERARKPAKTQREILGEDEDPFQ